MTVSKESFEKLTQKMGKARGIILFFNLAPEEVKEALTFEECKSIWKNIASTNEDDVMEFVLKKMVSAADSLQENLFALEAVASLPFIAKESFLPDSKLVEQQLEKKILEKFTEIDQWIDAYCDLSKKMNRSAVRKHILDFVKKHLEEMLIEADEASKSQG